MKTALTKTCHKCAVSKPLAEFHRDKSSQSGLCQHCKPCVSARKSAKYHADIDKARAASRAANRARMAKHPTHKVWDGMIQRCTNHNARSYMNYGGRGITVCERWRESYQAFAADMGPRPDGYQLDRIDNDGNYEPDNCRWVTPSLNTRNQRTRRDNKTGLAGVSYYNKAQDSYSAKIQIDGNRHRKYFKDFFEACCWRKSMENRHV